MNSQHTLCLLIGLTIAMSCLLTVAVAQDIPSHVATTPQPRDARWMARHEKFNAISKQGEAQLVFLGDSITQGWEGNGKEVWAKYWAPLNAANFGIGGDRTEHVLWRLQNGNFDGLKPKLIVLMIGTNNTGHNGNKEGYRCTAEQAADGVKAIVKTLCAKLPKTKILLLAIFPRGEQPDDKFRRQNEAINGMIKKLDDGKTVCFLDVGKTFLRPDGTLPKEIMRDRLHLSPAGYELWAKAIEGKIKELMK